MRSCFAKLQRSVVKYCNPCWVVFIPLEQLINQIIIQRNSWKRDWAKANVYFSEQRGISIKTKSGILGNKQEKNLEKIHQRFE